MKLNNLIKYLQAYAYRKLGYKKANEIAYTLRNFMVANKAMGEVDQFKEVTIIDGEVVAFGDMSYPVNKVIEHINVNILRMKFDEQRPKSLNDLTAFDNIIPTNLNIKLCINGEAVGKHRTAMNPCLGFILFSWRGNTEETKEIFRNKLPLVFAMCGDLKYFKENKVPDNISMCHLDPDEVSDCGTTAVSWTDGDNNEVKIIIGYSVLGA